MVGGGIVGIIPGAGAVAVFSPRLDEHGNSVRGLRVFEALSEEFDMHLFDFDRPVDQSVNADRHQRQSQRLVPAAIIATLLVLLAGAGTAAATWPTVISQVDQGTDGDAGEIGTIALVLVAVCLAVVIVGPVMFVRSRIRRHRSTD